MVPIVLMTEMFALWYERPMASFGDQSVEAEGVADLQNGLIGVQCLHCTDEPAVSVGMGGDKGKSEERSDRDRGHFSQGMGLAA